LETEQKMQYKQGKQVQQLKNLSWEITSKLALCCISIVTENSSNVLLLFYQFHLDHTATIQED